MMDNEGFQPSPPPVIGGQEAPATEPKKRGGRRGPRPAKIKSAPKNGRKKRGRPARAAAQSAPTAQAGLKIDLATAMQALTGLNPEEQKVVADITMHLVNFTPDTRGRILAALARLVG